MLEEETIDLKLSLGNNSSPNNKIHSSPSIHQWRKTSQPPPPSTPPIDHLHALFPKCSPPPNEGKEEQLLVYEDNDGSWLGPLDKDGGSSDGTMRKKLRLSKEQSSLLEDSFRHRHTLNSIEKRDLAKRLNLRPRQVEVWFQNRRARTKLKQTEVDKEYLRRCCERLSDENRRLREEVRGLRLMMLGWPASFQAPPHAVGVKAELCSSCEGAKKGSDVDGGLVKVVAVKPKLSEP